MACWISRRTVWPTLTGVIIAAIHQNDQPTANRLRTSIRHHAKKSQPCQMWTLIVHLRGLGTAAGGVDTGRGGGLRNDTTSLGMNGAVGAGKLPWPSLDQSANI